MPPSIAVAMASEISFSFFFFGFTMFLFYFFIYFNWRLITLQYYSDSLAGFIYLKRVDNCSCRSQSMVHIKSFNSFLYCHDFSLLLGSKCSITSGT